MTPTRSLLDAVATRLREAGGDQAGAEARILVAHVLDCPLSRLVLIRGVPDAAAARLEPLIRRRAAGEPLQYVLGRSWFVDTEVRVGPGVFIPRPETELLAARALEVAAGLPPAQAPRIVELCAGSGAISLVLARHLSHAQIHAVELSADALTWARRNLAGTGVDLRAGDMAEAFHDLDGRVDLVVANPPYVPLASAPRLPAEVTDHEPALALWSGVDGLDATRVVRDVARRLLRPGGTLLSEHSEDHADAVVRLLADGGEFGDVIDHLDLAGRPRFVEARRAAVAG